MAERYQYNYKPSGDNVAEIINWLKNQHDKGYSLNLIIRKAIHQYGPNTDLKQYMTDRFINDEYGQPVSNSAQTVTQPATVTTTSNTSNPTSAPTDTPTVESTATSQQPVAKPNPQPNNFLQKSDDDDQDTTETDPDEAPNFGFLSGNKS